MTGGNVRWGPRVTQRRQIGLEIGRQQSKQCKKQKEKHRSKKTAAKWRLTGTVQESTKQKFRVYHNSHGRKRTVDTLSQPNKPHGSCYSEHSLAMANRSGATEGVRGEVLRLCRRVGGKCCARFRGVCLHAKRFATEHRTTIVVRSGCRQRVSNARTCSTKNETRSRLHSALW